MIIEHVPNGVVTKGLGESKKFTIKTSAKAFKILSKSLYSNPVGAVVRELSTNAYDAQVVNGNAEVPFELTLPSTLNPEFKIRDFGTGLSAEQIDQVYRTFFESTKTESNDVVGCLGLGSKSPFTIADSFFVTSYYGGMKTMIMAYIDEDDEPALSEPLIYEPTDEPTGLEIQIAVRKEDIRSFEMETHRQLRHFTVKPKVLGQSQFNWSEDKIAHVVGTTKLSADFSESFAVQGQIAYPISEYMVSQKMTQEDWINRLIDPRAVLKNKCAIDFPIGSLDIAPSREALSYDERTVNVIKNRAIEVASEIEEFIIDYVNSSKDEIEAKQRWYEFKGKFNNYILQFDPKKFNFDVSDSNIFIEASHFEGVLKYYKGYRRYTNSVKSDTDKTVRDGKDVFYFNVCSGARFIRVPSGKKTGSIAIARALVNQNGKNVYMIRTDLSIERIQEILGSDTIEVKDFSEYAHLLLVKKQATKQAPKAKHSVKLLGTYASYRKSNCWTKVERELTAEDYYIEVTRDDVVLSNGSTAEPATLINFLNYCRRNELFEGNVYGLTPLQAKTTKAKSIMEFSKQFAEKNIKVDVVENALLNYDLDYDIPATSLFHEIVHYAKTIKVHQTNVYKTYDVRNWIEYSCRFDVKTEKIEHPEGLFDRYSLLNEAGIYRNNTALVAKMVRMIDCYAEQEGK